MEIQVDLSQPVEDALSAGAQYIPAADIAATFGSNSIGMRSKALSPSSTASYTF